MGEWEEGRMLVRSGRMVLNGEYGNRKRVGSRCLFGVIEVGTTSI